MIKEEDTPKIKTEIERDEINVSYGRCLQDPTIDFIKVILEQKDFSRTSFQTFYVHLGGDWDMPK